MRIQIDMEVRSKICLGEQPDYLVEQINFFFCLLLIYEDQNKFLFIFYATFQSFSTFLEFYCVVQKEFAIVISFTDIMNIDESHFLLHIYS